MRERATASSAQLNELEAKLTDAFASLGLRTEPAEHSFEGGPAVMTVEYADGTELEALATSEDTHRGEFTVTNERVINGLTVQHVEYIGDGPVGDAFSCGAILFEIRGPTPQGYVGMDDFLADYIAALECVRRPELPESR